MLKLVLFGAVLAAPFVHAEELELTVHLHTASKRQPCVYSIPAGVPPSFAEALELDLFHGGFFHRKPGHQDLEYLLGQGVETSGLAQKMGRSGLSYGITLWREGERVRLDSISDQGMLCSSLTYIMPTDPLEQRRIAHRMSDEVHEALFRRPPIGQTKILYVTSAEGKPGGATEVWECDCDGFGARKLMTDHHLAVSPAFLPPAPGRRPDGFVLVSYRLGPPKLWWSSFAKSSMERLSPLPGNQFHPSLSPQRDRIAFVCDAAGNPDLFIQAFSPERGVLGKARQLYTASRSVQASPCFSPDGNRIAFVSDQDGAQRIYILDIPPVGTPLNQIKPVCVTKRHKENTAPAWSPDGRFLAYCAKVDGVRQIWIRDLQTGEEKPLTSGPQHKENPSWAPDSLHLVFNSANNRRSELYVANLHEEGAVRISQGSGLKRFPAWEPRFPGGPSRIAY
jgi:TolB protein